MKRLVGGCLAGLWLLVATGCFFGDAQLPARDNPFDEKNKGLLSVAPGNWFVPVGTSVGLRVFRNDREVDPSYYPRISWSPKEGTGSFGSGTFTPTTAGVIILEADLPGNPRCALLALGGDYARGSDGNWQSSAGNLIGIEYNATLWVRNTTTNPVLDKAAAWEAAKGIAETFIVTGGSGTTWKMTLPSVDQLFSIHPSARSAGVSNSGIVATAAPYWSGETGADDTARVVNWAANNKNDSLQAKNLPAFVRPCFDLRTIH